MAWQQLAPSIQQGRRSELYHTPKLVWEAKAHPSTQSPGIVKQKTLVIADADLCA